MKVVLEKSFALAAAPQAAWALLQDVEAVAGCLPGARITERVDASHYKGTVTVKLGPASLAFRGEVEVREVDAAARSLSLAGRGTDTTGTSGAAMDLHANIEEAEGGGGRLVGLSEGSVSGKGAAVRARPGLGGAAWPRHANRKGGEGGGCGRAGWREVWVGGRPAGCGPGWAGGGAARVRQRCGPTSPAGLPPATTPAAPEALAAPAAE